MYPVYIVPNMYICEIEALDCKVPAEPVIDVNA